MERDQRNEARYWGRYLAVAGLLAGVAVPAACSPGQEGPAPPAAGTLAPASTATLAPESTVTLAPDNCTSVGAEQPGQYFNERYRQQIAEQLQLLHIAYTPGSNVDISSDGVTYFELVHAMENDPEYSQAMFRAANTVKARPQTAISVQEFLGWPVKPPVLCAPQRISDADRRQELQETKTVAQDVGAALLGHLANQSSRAVQSFAHYLSGELQQFLDTLNSELQQLNSH